MSDEMSEATASTSPTGSASGVPVAAPASKTSKAFEAEVEAEAAEDAEAETKARELEEADAAAAEENEKEWEPEEHKMEEVRASVSKEQAHDALESLLDKANKYTGFLQRKLMAARTKAPSTKASSTKASSTKASSSKASSASSALSASSKKRPLDKDTDKDKEDEEASDIAQPQSMTGGKLRSYQVKGFRWMVGLWENGLHGILADEMGLGKTVQTIAMIAHLREKHVWGPYLIVVPLSTLTNWISEIEKWVPDMPVLMYHGTKEEREEMRNAELSGFDHGGKKTSKKQKKGPGGGWGSGGGKHMERHPVVVTTYDIVVRDRKELQRTPWKHVIVDEGHRLKNFKCRLITELNLLCGGTAMRGGANKVLLTGTPLQNNLSELWSLLNFLMPEIFDNLEFFQSVFAFDGSAETSEEMVAQQEEQSIVTKLHRILAPFMMRRLKSEVEKNMPAKKEVVLYVPMTPPQRNMYDSIVEGTLAGMLEAATGSKSQLNNVLMQLRKCCLHPYLHFEPSAADGSMATTDALVQASGKLAALDRMLIDLKKKGHKVLIFSQFTTLLDILEDYLTYLRPQWKHCRIDGGVSLQQRKQQMDAFNTDPEHFVFLLSTRAGGVGINLMAADTVVIFDSDWNPHQDSQAQDRAHRIGQKNDVMVYRLITANSVELKILERANSKRKLERVVCAKQASIANSVAPQMGGAGASSGSKGGNMGAEELRALLKDDFTGHAEGANAGEASHAVIDQLLDRDNVFKGIIASKGPGYEIVEHKASSIVGSLNQE